MKFILVMLISLKSYGYHTYLIDTTLSDADHRKVKEKTIKILDKINDNIVTSYQKSRANFSVDNSGQEYVFDFIGDKAKPSITFKIPTGVRKRIIFKTETFPQIRKNIVLALDARSSIGSRLINKVYKHKTSSRIEIISDYLEVDGDRNFERGSFGELACFKDINLIVGAIVVRNEKFINNQVKAINFFRDSLNTECESKEAKLEVDDINFL